MAFCDCVADHTAGFHDHGSSPRSLLFATVSPIAGTTPEQRTHQTTMRRLRCGCSRSSPNPPGSKSFQLALGLPPTLVALPGLPPSSPHKISPIPHAQTRWRALPYCFSVSCSVWSLLPPIRIIPMSATLSIRRHPASRRFIAISAPSHSRYAINCRIACANRRYTIEDGDGEFVNLFAANQLDLGVCALRRFSTPVRMNTEFWVQISSRAGAHRWYAKMESNVPSRTA
jgi:hypothetical protein